jgi:hypothetical protein
VLASIRSVGESDFPYPESLEALRILQQRLEHFQSKLDLVEGADPETVKQTCAATVRAILLTFPYVGFILRSTNVRNAFEFHGPLLRLARQILGDQESIVLSSEWSYSPHIFPISIPGYALVGVPACESGNPFLLPLAGHELGHSLWRQLVKLTTEIKTKAVEHVVDQVKDGWSDHCKHFPLLAPLGAQWDPGDLEVAATYLEAVGWSLRQLQECFCDFVGLYVFGQSFFFASEYMLSPTWGNRSPFYPSTTDRARYLVEAASSYSIPTDADFEDQFTAQTLPQMEEKHRYLLRLADNCVATLVPRLTAEVAAVLDNRGIQHPSDAEIEEALRQIRIMVPVENAPSLAVILEAAWKAARDEKLWEKYEFVRDKADAVLQDLIIKSIEVFQFEHQTRNSGS